jgi:hypothetical protein
VRTNGRTMLPKMPINRMVRRLIVPRERFPNGQSGVHAVFISTSVHWAVVTAATSTQTTCSAWTVNSSSISAHRGKPWSTVQLESVFCIVARAGNNSLGGSSSSNNGSAVFQMYQVGHCDGRILALVPSLGPTTRFGV